MAIMKTRYLIASALIVLAAFGTASAHADPILVLTLTDPDQTVGQSTATVSFEATISNPSTTDTIFLNGDASATSSPFLTVNDSPFFANAPLSLAPGQSSGPFELFDVGLAADTPVGTYTLNTFSILGGADGGTFSDFADVADAQFSVTVAPATGSVPEPGTIALFGIGLAAFALARRRRNPGAVSGSTFLRREVAMSTLIKLLAACAVATGVTTAQATEQDFHFTLSGSGFSGSGVLGGLSEGDGQYLINSISGTIDGQTLSLLSTATLSSTQVAGTPPLYAAGGYVFDDVLFAGGCPSSTNTFCGTGGTLLDAGGLGLYVGGNPANLEGFDGTYSFDIDDNTTYPPVSFSATAVAGTVPEPATLALMAMGFAALGFARRKR